jgi:hypothetical protein
MLWGKSGHTSFILNKDFHEISAVYVKMGKNTADPDRPHTTVYYGAENICM